jgi:hypothetical protein
MRYALIIIFLFFSIDTFAQQDFKRRTKLSNAVQEVSGLVIHNKDSISMINDSGDQAIIYTLNSKGKLLSQQKISGIKNRDWEALASNGEDLFVGDFGNNCNCRKDLKIYQISKNGTIDSISFVLPDQNSFSPTKNWMNYDLESLAYSNNTLHLFSKNKVQKGNYYSKHYTINLEAKKSVIELRDSLLIPNLVITGAAFNNDGSECLLIAYDFKKLLGFIPYSTTRLLHFSNYDHGNVYSGDLKPYRIGPFFILGQYESVEWIDEKTALIASERTLFIGPRMKKIKLKAKKVP